METRHSKVNIRITGETKKVQFGSGLKPNIYNELIEKWQSMLDLAAEIVDVPSGLIMKLNEDNIEVYLKSRTSGNPYKAGGKEELKYGLYCETVIGTQKELLVPDARKDPVWKDNNPDIDLNMVSYLGFPINWPDGEVFGTVCLLDDEENHFGELYERFLNKVKSYIETDLELLVSNQQLKNKTEELEQANKTKSKFISLISHDVRTSVGSIDKLLKMILSNISSYSNEELAKTLSSMNISANQVYLTLENLLHWAKKDLVFVEANMESVNLVTIIEEVLDFLEPKIRFKNIKVITDFYSNDIFVHADQRMLETALRNLISNAVKFNYENGKLFIRVFKQDGHKVFEVEDTGVGMDRETRDQLFENEDVSGRQNAGLDESAGLGLKLSKEFLDKHGAKIDIESELEKGSKFIVKL